MENEKYRAKSPRHILMADASYFEEDGNEQEGYDIIDYRPPLEFQMDILFEKKWDLFLESPIPSMISLYFAPEQYLDQCLNLEISPRCDCSRQIISVENVQYRIIVDERQQNVETGEEGEWGVYQEYYNHDESLPKLCAVHIGFIVPEQEDFEGMRNRIYSLFEEVYPVQLEEQPGKESTIDAGKIKGSISIKKTLKELRNADHQETAHQVQRCCKKKEGERIGRLNPER